MKRAYLRTVHKGVELVSLGEFSVVKKYSIKHSVKIKIIDKEKYIKTTTYIIQITNTIKDSIMFPRRVKCYVNTYCNYAYSSCNRCFLKLPC